MASFQPVAEFLRYVLDHDNDAPPTGVLGADASQRARHRMMPFVRAVHQIGLIEPTMPPGFGPEGDLARVRVTVQGEEYLAGRRQTRPEDGTT